MSRFRRGAGGYLTVDVEAFDADYATKLSNAIIKSVDDMIDGLTARARADEVKFAESQVIDAQNKLRLARVALTEFQNLHGDINPQGSANQLSGIVGQIEGSLRRNARRWRRSDPSAPIRLRLRISTRELRRLRSNYAVKSSALPAQGRTARAAPVIRIFSTNTRPCSLTRNSPKLPIPRLCRAWPWRAPMRQASRITSSILPPRTPLTGREWAWFCNMPEPF